MRAKSVLLLLLTMGACASPPPISPPPAPPSASNIRPSAAGLARSVSFDGTYVGQGDPGRTGCSPETKHYAMHVSHDDVRVTEDGHPGMVLIGKVEPNGHVSLRAEQGPMTITYLDGDIAGGRFTGQMDTSLVSVGTCQFGVDLTRE